MFQDTKIRVNLITSEGHRTERLKMFKKNKFCSYFNKFCGDMFCGDKFSDDMFCMGS